MSERPHREWTGSEWVYPGEPGHSLSPYSRAVAWMKGHHQPSTPYGPDEYDVECYAGSEPPDGSPGWIPLYTNPQEAFYRPARRQARDEAHRIVQKHFANETEELLLLEEDIAAAILGR